MALPLHTTGSLTPLRTCSTRRSDGKFSLDVYTHCTISDRASPLSASVTLSEATAVPPNSVPRPDSGPQVRKSANQGWYPKGDSTLADANASKSPTYPVHDLPILTINYSEAPWGLSV